MINRGIRVPFSQILFKIQFCFNSIKKVDTSFKMIKIINNFLLPGDQFMPESHLRHPRVTYKDCVLFTKNKERVKIFQETRDS